MTKQLNYLKITLVCLVLVLFTSCKEKTPSAQKSLEISQEDEISQDEVIVPSIDTSGTTISTRFTPPKGFLRTDLQDESFAAYLRNFPLLDSKEQVHLFNGQLKGNQSAHAAILDIDVGNRDLQQCADAVMRLRAEYLYGQQKYDDIAFDFTNGWKFEYSKWRAGNDLLIRGNKTEWKPGSGPKDTYKDFRKYLDWVFMYAGTLSLSKELKSKKIEDVEIGDVFIFGGSPGHAVLVVDLAENEETGDKAFLMAQSYMPAQQIHVLRNPGNDGISPWYMLSEIGGELETPEWTFGRDGLMEF